MKVIAGLALIFISQFACAYGFVSCPEKVIELIEKGDKNTIDAINAKFSALKLKRSTIVADLNQLAKNYNQSSFRDLDEDKMSPGDLQKLGVQLQALDEVSKQMDDGGLGACYDIINPKQR